MKLLVPIFISIGFGLVSTNHFGVPLYNGYQVVTILANSTEHYHLLKLLFLSEEYDFWTPPKLNRNTDVMVSGQQMLKLELTLKKVNMGWTVKIPDVGRLIDEERADNKRVAAVFEGRMTWFGYQRWSVIEPWILSLGTNYPGIASVSTIGQTFEGRSIRMVKVSTGTLPDGANKKVIYLDANIHANEWIGGASSTWMLNELVTNSNAYKDILDEIDFYIVPLINLDGYEYSHTTDRMWRKTRSLHPTSPCKGCDPNRNFDFHWGGENTSPDPCHNNYHGPFAFSEKETQAIRDTLRGIQNTATIWAYITLHSYGQVWMLPWGYTAGEYPDDFPELLAWGEASVADMKAVNGKVYVAGQGAETLYGVGGGSDDYAKNTGIKYSATVELRDEGAFGFLLPSLQIVPTAQEIWAGVLRTARIVMAH